jgi:putative pyruvate formate lyase activating enzyme
VALRPFTPAYLALHRQGRLVPRARDAWLSLGDCRGCAWQCRVDRLAGETGRCGSGPSLRVASHFPHFGEEDCLRGWRGSGTIFLSRCNLRCQFCQNYDVSHLGAGQDVTPQDLAGMMLDLQEQGCHNINLVSPSHVVPQIMLAVAVAAEAGLHLPLVYNSGGYDSLESLKLLDGVIDIYMPDMKYADAAVARRYSKVPDYPRNNQAAVREMHRQVGDLEIDHDGLARRGLLVRHLVLPHGLAGTAAVARFLADEVSTHTYINVMDQYRPAFRASRYPDLSRPVSRQEYQEAVSLVQAAGLERLDRRQPTLSFLSR